jgi:hypothetical protein
MFNVIFRLCHFYRSMVLFCNEGIHLIDGIMLWYHFGFGNGISMACILYGYI